MMTPMNKRLVNKAYYSMMGILIILLVIWLVKRLYF